MRHPYRTVIVAVAAVVLCSCSWSYPFQLLLTVKNVENGQPLEGVVGVIDTHGVEESKERMDYGHSLSGPTNAQGQLTHDFSISGGATSSRWYMKLQKEGFELTVIDIKPNPTPQKKGEVTVLPVTVEMKPLPTKP